MRHLFVFIILALIYLPVHGAKKGVTLQRGSYVLVRFESFTLGTRPAVPNFMGTGDYAFRVPPDERTCKASMLSICYDAIAKGYDEHGAVRAWIPRNSQIIDCGPKSSGSECDNRADIERPGWRYVRVHYIAVDPEYESGRYFEVVKYLWVRESPDLKTGDPGIVGIRRSVGPGSDPNNAKISACTSGCGPKDEAKSLVTSVWDIFGKLLPRQNPTLPPVGLPSPEPGPQRTRTPLDERVGEVKGGLPSPLKSIGLAVPKVDLSGDFTSGLEGPLPPVCRSLALKSEKALMQNWRLKEPSQKTDLVNLYETDVTFRYTQRTVSSKTKKSDVCELKLESCGDEQAPHGLRLAQLAIQGRAMSSDACGTLVTQWYERCSPKIETENGEVPLALIPPRERARSVLHSLPEIQASLKGHLSNTKMALGAINAKLEPADLAVCIIAWEMPFWDHTRMKTGVCSSRGAPWDLPSDYGLPQIIGPVPFDTLNKFAGARASDPASFKDINEFFSESRIEAVRDSYADPRWSGHGSYIALGQQAKTKAERELIAQGRRQMFYMRNDAGKRHSTAEHYMIGDDRDIQLKMMLMLIEWKMDTARNVFSGNDGKSRLSALKLGIKNYDGHAKIEKYVADKLACMNNILKIRQSSLSAREKEERILDILTKRSPREGPWKK
ncbi:MAG: hypothetical protein IT289_07165 [Oligoflexia bacterium]|nr:hypothetical protein [Oligoflexia bacterium]